MKPQECINANWQNIGYNDAINGRSVWLKSRTEACAKINLKPNRKAYLTGHQAGSKKFCTYRNGYAFGRRGDERNNICLAPNLAKPFYKGQKDGLSDYEDELDRQERMYEMMRRLRNLRNHHN